MTVQQPAFSASQASNVSTELEQACITLHDERGPKSQATVLTEIGQQHHLFHDQDGEAFARVTVADHAEVFRITGGEYRDLLGRAYYLLSGAGANRNAITDAVATLTATARYAGPEESVHLRVGSTHSGSGIVIDTGAADWAVIEVTASGWRKVRQHSINFAAPRRRRRCLSPLKPTSA
jgi:hypothetical protein